MKKLMTFAAIFAAVMVSFSACNKEGNEGEGNGQTNVCPECGEDPCVCEEEYASPITIDGDFADWAALDASKVATATCAEGAKWTAMKNVKVYADEVYVNIYFEYDTDEIVGDSPIDIYLNADNDASEYNNNFLGQSAQDFLLEGSFYAEADGIVSFDPSLFSYGGAADAEVEWAWDEVLAGPAGIASGAGVAGKYELAILREMLMGVELADTFGLGITISQSWEPVGLLPNDTVTDENTNGSANFLQVTTVK